MNNTGFLSDCTVFGPALPEPFVRFELESYLGRAGLLPKTTGDEGRALQARWEAYRRRIKALSAGGKERVYNQIVMPLVEPLGYGRLQREDPVRTREGDEDGGSTLVTDDGATLLRVWTVALGTDLDAPSRRGTAYRFSPSRSAQRVLLTKGERLGLLTDGAELRLLLCDPARPDSHITIPLQGNSGWERQRKAPDSFRVLLALASPRGVRALPELTEAARQAQTRVTGELRKQAKTAVIEFIQALLDHESNRAVLAAEDPAKLPVKLWEEGLTLVYRLLFILKMESSADPARAFSFATSGLWRRTYSPTGNAMEGWVRRRLDRGTDTGQALECGLRTLFRIFRDGLRVAEMNVAPLGGMLFGRRATPLLDSLHWGEDAVAHLLDRLLWTDGASGRERVHYGPLDVEDLGRVYEALIELEPGVTTEPMVRLRRAKLEVVVPEAAAEPYRAAETAAEPPDDDEDAAEEGAEDEEDGEEDAPAPRAGRGGGTRVTWIERIPTGRFYLRVGLGRKSSGSYYTPHPFVRFLVQEALEPQVRRLSPAEDPNPAALLALKVLDPAMGSGHFLVEACRYLGDKLYESCRLCDERAADAERGAADATNAEEKAALLQRATELRQRVEALPDPKDELVAYLPSRSVEGSDSGLSQKRAEALCRRLVAVHCLYGVDRNPLAVELAKLALWLESYAEGLPLTFMNHRLVVGDSLTGPFFEHLLTQPVSGKAVNTLFVQTLEQRMRAALADALLNVRRLNGSIGKDIADLEQKQAAYAALLAALAPLRKLGELWSGAVMLGEKAADLVYERAVQAFADTGTLPAAELAADELALRMLEAGGGGVMFDLAFPEVFHPDGGPERTGGFDAVLGNPPWDKMLPAAKEFFAGYDLRVLDAPTKRERKEVTERLSADPAIAARHARYMEGFRRMERVVKRLYRWQVAIVNGKRTTGKQDIYRLFLERVADVVSATGRIGQVVPSAFHANEGATGIRRLYLDHLSMKSCFSFENTKKLFEIDSRFKFAVVSAAVERAGNGSFSCAFYLHNLDWLFADKETLTYDRGFIESSGGAYMAFPELRNERDVRPTEKLYSKGRLFGRASAAMNVTLGRELNMTDDSERFVPTQDTLGNAMDPRHPEVATDLLDEGYLPLHEGKTFHQFNDRWDEPPQYLIPVTKVTDKPDWLAAASYYRLVFRDVASSTNERTGIFTILPPGFIVGNTAPCERSPWNRPMSVALSICAVANTHAFDWPLRQKAAAHVNLFILNQCPVPDLDEPGRRLAAHTALRLVCNHAGYEALWRDQLGDHWREGSRPFTWPVLAGDHARWRLRAAVDALVAKAYGLDRDDYAHILSGFSHRSYPEAPRLCLAAFDELEAKGLDAFVRDHDPYWDVPLNEALPKPAIDLVSRILPSAPAGAPPVDRAGQYSLLARDDGPLFAALSSLPADAGASPAPKPRKRNGDDGEAYAAILRLLGTKSPITSAEAQAATGLDSKRVGPLLKRLVAEGHARVEGQARGTTYHRLSPLQIPPTEG